MKRFEYSPLGKELKKQTSVAEKQYRSFDKAFNHNEKEEPVKIKKEGPLTTDESSLFYNNKYSFIEFKNIGKYMDDFLVTRYINYLAPFKQRMEEFKKFTPGKAKTKAKKKNNAKKLYSILLSIYYNDYNDITDKEKKRWVKNIILITYLLKVKDLLNRRKKMKKKVNHSQKKLLLKE